MWAVDEGHFRRNPVRSIACPTMVAIALNECSDQQCCVFKMTVKQQTTLRSVALPFLLPLLRASRRRCADGFFGLDTPAPVRHRIHQLADLLARAFIVQVHLLAEQSGGPWHQHLWVRYHDGTDATEHSPQGGLCVCRARLAQNCTHHCHRFVAQHALTTWSRRPVDRVGQHPRHRAVVLRSGDQDGV